MLELIQSTILYVGLLVLLVWRCLFPWPKEKGWQDNINYITLLYMLVGALYLFELVEFSVTLVQDIKAAPATQRPPVIFRWLAIAAPIAIALCIALGWAQSREHLREIREGSSAIQHDRVLNMIALPAVYGVIIMGAMTSMYKWVLEESKGEVTAEIQAKAFAAHETCVFVADTYEAWALFQFGALVSEQLDLSLGRREFVATHSQDPHTPNVNVSISAMASMMWIGLTLFGAVCLLQAGWSLYLWYFQILEGSQGIEEYEASLTQFHLAGLVSSSGAIYNVVMFERTFGHFIEGFAPFFKFFSIKVIVFFAFWQAVILDLLRVVHILPYTEIQVKFLSSALMCLECLFCSIIHWMAWRAEEVWYEPENPDSERKPLMAGDSKNPFSPI